MHGQSYSQSRGRVATKAPQALIGLHEASDEIQVLMFKRFNIASNGLSCGSQPRRFQMLRLKIADIRCRKIQ